MVSIDPHVSTSLCTDAAPQLWNCTETHFCKSIQTFQCSSIGTTVNKDTNGVYVLQLAFCLAQPNFVQICRVTATQHGDQSLQTLFAWQPTSGNGSLLSRFAQRPIGQKCASWVVYLPTAATPCLRIVILHPLHIQSSLHDLRLELPNG